MAHSDLITAQYYQQCEAEPAAGDDSQIGQSLRPRAKELSFGERAMKWISYATAGAVAICVVALAVPFIASLGSAKGTHPIDWWLRLGGAGSDQTFQKFIENTATANQREWEERYRQSPIYPMESQPIDWQLQPGMNMNRK